MYSPAALNVPVVLTISPCLVADSRALANVTVPGPRNLCNETAATVVDGRPPSPCAGFGSSTQILKVRGCPTFPVIVAAMPAGGPVNFGPPSAKATTGGALPIPNSLNGVIGYPLFKVSGIDCFSPFETIVHVSALFPKSLGTLSANTPHCRPTSKYVGWPWSAGPGSILLSAPTGI